MLENDAIVNATMKCFYAPAVPDATAAPAVLGTQAVAFLEDLLATDPETLMDQCLLILRTANTILEEEGKQLGDIFLGQGSPIVCGAGCTGCCHQLVLCQPFEARSIQLYLQGQPEKMRAFRAAYPLWDKATAAMRDSYLAWAVRRYGQDEDSGGHVFEDYQAPCPFLDAEGQCEIYPVRPYGCRTCIALDPACAEPRKKNTAPLQLQYSLYTTHHAARTAVTHMLVRRLGTSPMPVAMPEVLAKLCCLS